MAVDKGDSIGTGNIETIVDLLIRKGLTKLGITIQAVIIPNDLTKPIGTEIIRLFDHTTLNTMNMRIII